MTLCANRGNVSRCRQMLDPLTTGTTLVGLVPLTFQAAKALGDTLDSFSKHPKQIRGLVKELEELIDQLEALESILDAPGGKVNLNLLEAPLKRCKSGCQEWAQALQDCRGRNSGGATSDFTGWLKIRRRGIDINEFRDVLAGYNSTVAIAIAGANLRTTKVSLGVIRQYEDMIEDARADLSEHLSNIDDRLGQAPERGLDSDDSASESDMRAERLCTIHCLEICAQVSGFVEERQQTLAAHVSDTGQGASREPVDQGTEQTLRAIKSTIKTQHTQLSRRLQLLNTKLSSTSGDRLTPAERIHVVEEADSIRQCLEICDENAKDAQKFRVNVIEDFSIGDDSSTVVVSTIGDLISAHRVTFGVRSNIAIGQMSDETVKHVSNVHATRVTNGVQATKGAAKDSKDRDGSSSNGRVLGTGNIKTL